MLEKPDLQDEQIIACLREDYGLTIVQIAFLPLGADRHTAVFRAVTGDGTPYFVKLRSGDFDSGSVTVPKYLSDQGIKQIIPSLATQTGHPWADLEPFKVILYPFVEGRNGFEVDLSDQQRVEFGAALKRFHTAAVPAALTSSVPRETFSPRWRNTVRGFLEGIEHETFEEPVAKELAEFLRTKLLETLKLVQRSARLALAFQARSQEYILCHGDIHGWNLLIDGQGALYIVDWDTLIFAPRERDLMFVGAGLGGNGHSLAEEVSLFYQGYGPTRIDPIGIAYYRNERIVEDIAVYCQQLLLSDEGGEDRQQSLEQLQSNYLPGRTIELARRSDPTTPEC